MFDSIFFLGFLLMAIYIIYWSFMNDDDAPNKRGKGRKSKFTMEDARARRKEAGGD